MAKTVVCPSTTLRERHTTVRGSLVSACEAGMKRTYFRESNAEHGLQELGKRWEEMEKTPVWRTEYLEARHTGVRGDGSV